MKKILISYKSLFVLFLFLAVSFGIKATPVQASACSLLGGNNKVVVTPTTANIGDTVTITGFAQGCDDVQINYDSLGPVSGPFRVTKTVEELPQYFDVYAYSNTTCATPAILTSPGDFSGNTYLCGHQTVIVSAPPATVNVSNTCVGSTWTSTGQSGGYGSSSFTVNPPVDGQTVTITPGTLPSGYKWDPITQYGSQQQVSPGDSIEFGLSCSQIQITPTLTASPNQYQCGGTTTLTWGQQFPENTTSCSASWTSSTAVSGSQVVTPNANPQTYSITCYGANGASGFASISVPMVANSCSGATVDVSANPTSVSPGGNSTISWTGTNVVSNSCTPGWNWTNSTGASGSQLISNIVSTTNFPMSCTSSVGGANPSGSATVTVVPPNTPPEVSISATPNSGTVGVNPQLTWSATGSPTSCTASNAWTGTKASTGSGVYQGPISTAGTYTYTLACTNAYGTDTKSATVVVSAAPINGSCGATPAHWSCPTGTSANNTGGTSGPWTWSCVGSGTGHTDDPCSQATTPQDEACTIPTDTNYENGPCFRTCKNGMDNYPTCTTASVTYSLSNGGTISINRGSTQTNTITRTPGTGTQAPVTLSATVLPPDLTISFSNQTCIPTCTSTITLGASNTATVGPHTVTVAGSPASSNGPTSFTVNVSAGSSPVVSCSPSSSSALVGQPVTWSANVSGGTPPYTYVWSGTPPIPTAPAPTHVTSNTTDTYATPYTTTGLKHASVRVTDSVSNFGDCINGGYPGSDVQINFNPTFQEF